VVADVFLTCSDNTPNCDLACERGGDQSAPEEPPVPLSEAAVDVPTTGELAGALERPARPTGILVSAAVQEAFDVYADAPRLIDRAIWHYLEANYPSDLARWDRALIERTIRASRELRQRQLSARRIAQMDDRMLRRQKRMAETITSDYLQKGRRKDSWAPGLYEAVATELERRQEGPRARQMELPLGVGAPPRSQASDALSPQSASPPRQRSPVDEASAVTLRPADAPAVAYAEPTASPPAPELNRLPPLPQNWRLLHNRAFCWAGDGTRMTATFARNAEAQAITAAWRLVECTADDLKLRFTSGSEVADPFWNGIEEELAAFVPPPNPEPPLREWWYGEMLVPAEAVQRHYEAEKCDCRAEEQPCQVTRDLPSPQADAWPAWIWGWDDPPAEEQGPSASTERQTIKSTSERKAC
jgi:hypothetical protein